MSFRRRRRFTRRGSGLRWFVPELWNGPQPGALGFGTIGAATSVYIGDTVYTRIVAGSAPFAGVTNAAGLLTGKMLEQRQMWCLKRLVGRFQFAFVPDDEIVLSNGGHVRLHWAIIRAKVENTGVPDENTFINLTEREEMDDKPTILYQDCWQTNYPVGTTLPTNSWNVLAAEPPLYSMIDIKTKRWFGNEQDLFLATQYTMFANNGSLTAGAVINEYANLNIRVLGRFGR